MPIMAMTSPAWSTVMPVSCARDRANFFLPASCGYRLDCPQPSSYVLVRPNRRRQLRLLQSTARSASDVWTKAQWRFERRRQRLPYGTPVVRYQ